MRLIILPQAFRAMVPLLLTQGIVLFQDTSLVYVLSLADFFRTASTIGHCVMPSARAALPCPREILMMPARIISE